MAEVDFSQAANFAGGAVSDLFSGIGAKQAASSYRTAAKYAGTNVDLETASLGIKRVQLQRELYRATGGQKADIASAGFGASGTALDLMRDTASQGALARAQLEVQGGIEINAAEAQVAASEGQARAEETSAAGNFIGSALNAAALILPFILSDRRAKFDVEQIGMTLNGLPWYSFRYLHDGSAHEGLMSDDVRAFRPAAVIVGEDGFDRVNYTLALA